MAPTELLARQHAENAAALLEPLGLHIAFLTGNIKARGRAHLLKALASGDIDVVIGTHALFSADVSYKNLRLAIIDEQHRFGVNQRRAILAKSERCHLLQMSATPIPRSLAMTVYGDMDVSVIRDMPPGRKPVETHLASMEHVERVYTFVRRLLDEGRQAYFVYPLIMSDEDSSGEEKGLKAAEKMVEYLGREIYPGFKTALIHSKLDEEVKRSIMAEFRSGAVQILVATSVVEVGVDVPNAACMVIEHAERFGLSALHQLRGRVGRGSEQAYCFLVYSDQEVPPGLDATELEDEERTKMGQRLMIMRGSNDGFLIAEKDLELRGPGQISGMTVVNNIGRVEQSGRLALGLADPVRDMPLLLEARADVLNILGGENTHEQAFKAKPSKN
jgi:ATP-dependent DNA helicase RecG